MTFRTTIACLCLLTIAACAGPTGQPNAQADYSAFVASQLVELETLTAPEGVSTAEWTALKDGLAEMLRASDGKRVSTPPSSNASKTVLALSGGDTLDWGFYSAGDYDQNGEVNISDLTPLAIRLGQAVPGGNPNSALAVCDGDNNGEVNLAELTPIGANFTSRLAGYNIYRSLNAADAPANNTAESTIAPLGFIDLDDSTPSVGGSRRLFNFTDAAPVADAFYWVRPTDGELEGTASNLVGGPPGAGAPVEVIPEANNEAYLSTQLLVVNGNPAICYDNFTNATLVYVRALDANGSTWGTPQVLVDYSPNDSFSSPSMVIVNGNPAIAFWDLSQGDTLGYIRALDANGDTWGPIVTAAGGTEVGDYPSLKIVEGFPSIACFDYPNDAAVYVRANDADGATWGGPITVITPMGQIDAQETPDSMSLAIINGRPAIACLAAEPHRLLYCRAADTTGSAWGSSVQIAGEGYFVKLRELGGVPVVAYGTLSSGELYFCRAQEADGNFWNFPQFLAGGGAGASLSLSVLGGLPAISYHDITAPEQDLRLIRAEDAAGLAWGVATVLDDDGYKGIHSSLLELPGGSAAVAYVAGDFGQPGSVQYLFGF